MPPHGQSTVLVQRFDIRQTRKGEDFATLRLNLGRDANFGTIDAKIWQFDKFRATGRPLPAEGVIMQARYKTGEYQGVPQWTIEDYDILEGEKREAALELFSAPKRIDVEFYEAKLDELLEEAGPDRVSGAILHELFDKKGFREAFCQAPAAAAHHQNYPGGLLEHTLNVTSVALAIAEAYSPRESEGLSFNRERLPTDRALLIAAGLLHDIGKIKTYRFAPMSETTDFNNFEGHLAISYAVVHAIAAPLRAEPPHEGAVDEIDKLLNCILSHHGSLEFGSPVGPACIEAFILSQADLTDARVSTVVTEGNQLLRQNPTARWLRHFHFKSGMFVGDWPEPPKV